MTYSDWLAGENPRVLLAKLVSATATKYVASETYISGGQQFTDPANLLGDDWATVGAGASAADNGSWSEGRKVTVTSAGLGYERQRQILTGLVVGETYTIECTYEVGSSGNCLVGIYAGDADDNLYIAGAVGSLSEVLNQGVGTVSNITNTNLGGSPTRYTVSFDFVPIHDTDWRIGAGPYSTTPAEDVDILKLTIEEKTLKVFDGRIMAADVEWRMGAALGRTGVANGGDLIIGNPDGALDDWLSLEWESVTYWYGDPSWFRGQFATIFEAEIETVEGNDTQISFSLRDRYVDLSNPIQTIMPVPAPSADLKYPIGYGYVYNATPIITEPNSAPEYRVCEPPCEDSAVARYKNQAAFTSPGIVKSNASAQFDLNSDPSARVTVDFKGKLNGSSTWIENLGEALKDALTRTHNAETGVLTGGSSTTVVLPETSSSVDDYYNGKTIRKWVQADAAVGDHTTAESKTISDYDGATRTVTISGSWTTDAAEGDIYRIANETVQAGPLSESDLDTAAFTQFDTDYPYQIGLFIDDGTTTAQQMLDQALAPGAYHSWTTGLDDGVSRLTIGILKDPSSETEDYELTESDLFGDVERMQEVSITKKLRLGFQKNHTVSNESHDADAARAAWVENEYRWIAKGVFRPEVDPEQADRSVETLITDDADAVTELDRLWDLMSVQRHMYVVRSLLKPLEHGVGAVVKVTDDRHELSDTKLIVTGILFRPLEETCELELWG